MYFELIEKELEKAFKEYKDLAFQENKDEKKIAEKVGLIHWWLANAMFYSRGSAAIADYTSKVLLDNAGIKYGLWQKNIQPDLEAFMTSQHDFARKYADGVYFE